MNFTIVLLVIALGLIASVVAGIRNARKTPGGDPLVEMQALAHSEGWSFARPSGGDRTFVIAAGEWELAGLFFRGANRATTSSNHQTEWSAPWAGDAVVLLGPRLPSFVSRLDLQSDRVQSALRPLVGERISLLKAAERFADVGDEAFTRQFDVIASSRDAAEQVVGDGSHWNQLKAQLPGSPVVLIGDGKVTLVVKARLRSQSEAIAMVRAGEALLQALG